MKRRNLFRLLACAVAASAMDVMGLVPVRAPGVPRLRVETLWQRVKPHMLGGPQVMEYCVSDRRPDELSQEELARGLKEGNQLVCDQQAYSDFMVEYVEKTGMAQPWRNVG